MHHRSVLLGCALGALAIAGCGSDAKVVETKDGKVTVAKDGKTVTIEGENGAQATFGSSKVPDGFPSEVPLPTGLKLVSSAGAQQSFTLGYGFGSVGHMLYMMQQMAPGPYKTAHYAFATGVMGLCMMSTGMVSGVLQQAVGYQGFFLLVLAASVLPLVVAWNAPFPVDDEREEPARSAG